MPFTDEVDGDGGGGRAGTKRRGSESSQADILSKDAEPPRTKDRWKYRVEVGRNDDGGGARQRPIKLIPTGNGDEGGMNGDDLYTHAYRDMLALCLDVLTCANLSRFAARRVHCLDGLAEGRQKRSRQCLGQRAPAAASRQ